MRCTGPCRHVPCLCIHSRPLGLSAIVVGRSLFIVLELNAKSFDEHLIDDACFHIACAKAVSSIATADTTHCRPIWEARVTPSLQASVSAQQHNDINLKFVLPGALSAVSDCSASFLWSPVRHADGDNDTNLTHIWWNFCLNMSQLQAAPLPLRRTHPATRRTVLAPRKELSHHVFLRKPISPPNVCLREASCSYMVAGVLMCMQYSSRCRHRRATNSGMALAPFR